MTAVAATGELVALGGTAWTLWRDAGLRSAGFPAERFLGLCDAALAAAADQPDDARYAAEFEAATARLSVAIRRTARDSAFREAVAWQNPALLRTCLDKAAAGEPRNVRGRNHELSIATYLQRYCLKNDTIGFFGPVGWARLAPGDPGLTVSPGSPPLARRTTYFEHWAIQAVADAIAELPGVFPWLCPRREPSAVVGGGRVRVPFRRPASLSPREARLLSLCDGTRTVRELVGTPPDPAVVAGLRRLRELGALRIDLRGPVLTWPERELAARLDAIGDKPVRRRALAVLDDVVRARDAVAQAAGDPGRLAVAHDGLAAAFERATGKAPHRRAGDVYAARTLVYEDTVRNVEVRVGRQLTDTLAGPLGLVLDSAAWLADRVAERFEARARELLTPTGAMPLLQVLTSVLPELGTGTTAARSDLVENVVEEFQRRWARVLATPADVSWHRVSAASIAGAVAREFPAGTARWRGARWYAPDVLVDGADFVLGEVHCAANTLRYRMFTAQHPDPERLRSAIEAVEPDGRVVLVPGADAPQTTARMSVDLLLPRDTYVCLGAEALAPPAGATVLSVLDLDVVLAEGRPVVRHRGTGAEYDFAEVLGEPLSALVSGAFRPFAPRARVPRVSIGRLVFGRAAWTFPPAGARWAFEKDERRRYRLARRWRRDTGLPERTFARLPGERKPVAVDFRSLPLVNLLAKGIRQAPGPVTLTEMLPDLDGLWLPDAEGRRYTAELRLLAVRPEFTATPASAPASGSAT
ncbi:lantibiotic dehydratase [Amycolatopsis sacchari]|uniref:lantibiotic dehydratase n=1 Tax=Amycolatopsis sacchari TaxID=115433 RepID=UPI003D742634